VIVLMLSSITVALFLILGAARYLARLVRTEARKSRLDSKRASVELQDALTEDLRRQIVEGHNRNQEATQKALHGHSKKLDLLDSRARKDTRNLTSHIRNTAHHATTETEALIQIYSKFPDVKLPMPASGSWAVDAQSLAYLLSLAQDIQPRRILELGSGTSSIWLGYLCRRSGADLITLDHLDEYLQKTRAAVNRHGLDHVIDTRFAPLEKVQCDGKEFDWYSIDALSDVTEIDLLLVDGPPAATGPRARYPALPVLSEQLSDKAVVVLDDAHRPDEVHILKGWREQFPDFHRVAIGTPRLAILERRQGST
jgi:predicted O-methyltransferase YrrM